MHTAHDRKIMLNEMNATKAIYYHTLDNFATMRASGEEVEQSKRVYDETCTALHVMLNPNLTPQHDYTARVKRLRFSQAKGLKTWQVCLFGAKRAYIMARNGSPLMLKVAYRRHQAGHRIAAKEGVSPEDFRAFWRSL